MAMIPMRAARTAVPSPNAAHSFSGKPDRIIKIREWAERAEIYISRYEHGGQRTGRHAETKHEPQPPAIENQSERDQAGEHGLRPEQRTLTDCAAIPGRRGLVRRPDRRAVRLGAWRASAWPVALRPFPVTVSVQADGWEPAESAGLVGR
jgi:hypothetical protein